MKSFLVGMLVVASLTPQGTASTVSINVPSTIAAGETLDVVVTNIPPAVETMNLIVIGGLASSIVPLAISGGQGQASINNPAVLRAGVVTVAVEAQDGSAVNVMVEPGPTAQPIYPAVSPSRVQVGGPNPTMIVLPEDQFGNPQPAGTEVFVSVTDVSGSTSTHQTVTDGLLGAIDLVAGTVAGITNVSVRVEDARATGSFQVVSGPPMPYALLEPPFVPVADGQSQFVVESEFLVDRFGNPIADGTSVIVEVVESSQRTKLETGQTIGGRGRLSLTAPRQAESLTITLVIDGVRSAPLTVNLQPLGAGS